MTLAPRCKLCGSRHWSTQGHSFKESVTKSSVVDSRIENVTREPVKAVVTKSNGTTEELEIVTPKRGGSRLGAGRKKKHKDNAARQKAWRGR